MDAARSGGRTDWIRVRSEAGEPLVLDHGIEGDLDERGRRVRYRPVGRAGSAVPLRRGETVVVARRGVRDDAEPRDVPANGPAEAWGLP